MSKILLALTTVFVCSVILVGCGEDEIVVVDSSDSPTVSCPNPISTSGVEGFRDGNLLKPVSDGGSPPFTGNPVFLIRSLYTERFNTCVARGRNGDINLTCIDNAPWTPTPFNCFANGNRQHFRSPVPCTEWDGVRVTCEDDCQTVVFRANGEDPCERQE